MKLEAPKINMPKPEPKPALKPIQMEAKLTVPAMKAAKPSIILAPQPKAALTAAAPAQVPQAKPSTAPVHFGETFGVTPNPNASQAGDGGGDRQPLWRNDWPGGGAAGSGGLDRASAMEPGPDRTPESWDAWPRRVFRAQPELELRATYGGGKVASAGIPQMTARRRLRKR